MHITLFSLSSFDRSEGTSAKREKKRTFCQWVALFSLFSLPFFRLLHRAAHFMNSPQHSAAQKKKRKKSCTDSWQLLRRKKKVKEPLCRFFFFGLHNSPLPFFFFSSSTCSAGHALARRPLPMRVFLPAMERKLALLKDMLIRRLPLNAQVNVKEEQVQHRTDAQSAGGGHDNRSHAKKHCCDVSARTNDALPSRCLKSSLSVCRSSRRWRR